MMMMLRLLVLLTLSSCTHHYVCNPLPSSPSSNFLVILVDARQLDYSTPQTLFKTLAKHPSDYSKNGDVGHAWIYLEGQGVYLEGGHSGELGYLQPRYMEGVFTRFQNGKDNPISYLWESQKDGFFQYGSGKHTPTYAARIELTQQQFDKILKYIENYDYTDYAITGNQCCTFAAQLASFAGLDLDCHLTMNVDSCIRIGGTNIRMWDDPVYAEFSFSSPDVLEESLKKAVSEGKASDALPWYRMHHPCNKRFDMEDVILFPRRILRYLSI